MVIPVLVALDVPTLESAEELADGLVDHVGGFKVGLELLMAEGPRAVSAIAERGLPVFADAKLHDIPNTTKRAAAELAANGARWVTVHAMGGGGMIEAAAEGMGRGRESGVLGVTVLTSLDDSDLADLGVTRSIPDQVASLARLAESHGAEGVVCSPQEAPVVKTVASGLLTVTPGIRPVSVGRDDQKRVTTPRRALEGGADLLVIGRAITGADDPVSAAARIAADIADLMAR